MTLMMILETIRLILLEQLTIRAALYMGNTKIILWGIKASPYVCKVMVALAEKNLDYEHREILPSSILMLRGETIPDEFAQASPFGKIPAMKVDGFCIADSAVITAFLDREFPNGNSLYPINTQEYAKALWFEHYADTALSDISYHKIFKQSIINPRLLNKPTDYMLVKHAIQIELPPILIYLQQSVLKAEWLAGDNFSMADVAIAVQLLALKAAGISLEVEQWSTLNNYLNKVIAQPSFKKCLSN